MFFNEMFISLQNRKTVHPSLLTPHARKAGHSKTAKQQNSKTAKQQNSKTAKQQNSKTAKQQTPPDYSRPS
jgi:hypothetical protein